MNKFSKVLFSVVATLWLVIIVTRVMASFDKKREREIYERGVMQTVTYHYCMGKYPSQAFRDHEWNLINMPEDCRYVQAIDRELSK